MQACDSSSEAFLVYSKNWRSKASRTPVCPRQLSEVGEQYIRDIVGTVSHVVSKVRIQRSKSFQRTNFDSVFGLGFRILHNSTFGLLPNDKDGGFCLIEKETIGDEKTMILSSGKYVPVKAASVDFGEIVQEYRDVADALQEVTNFEGLATAFKRPLQHARPKNLISQLEL